MHMSATALHHNPGDRLGCASAHCKAGRLPRRVLHRQGGFSLLEVMVALAISLAIGALLISNLRSSTENQQATIVGQQEGDGGRALNAYVAMRYGAITNMTTIGSGCGTLSASGFSGIGTDVSQQGTPSDPGPRCCATYSDGINYCQITSDTLRRNGLLPNSFSGYNAFGAQYEYFIRIQGGAPAYIVDGIVFTNTPYTTGGATPRYDLLGQAMNQAGADSGMTQTSANLVSGLNGAWNDSWPFINQLGLLAYRVGYGTSGYAAYLRLDGSTAMTGDLLMGSPTSRHNIDYVANLDAQTATFAGTGTDNTATVSINNTATGVSDTDLQPITSGTGQGGLAIRNDAGVYVMSRTGAGASDLTAKDITASGGYINASASGTAPTSPDNNPGTVSADSVVSRGNVQLRGTSGTYGFLFDPTFGGGWYMSDSSWIRAAGAKNIYTPATLRADSYVVAAQGLQVGNGYAPYTVTPGTACGPVAGLNGIGLAESNAANEILQCKNGIWTPLGVNTTVVTGATAGPGGTSTPTCASGSVVTGGGYRVTSYAPVSPSGLSNAPDISMPNGTTGWYLYVDPVASGNSTFTAYALCSPGG